MIKFFKKNTDPHLDPLNTSEQTEEKITEKVFSKNLLMAALGIFICIIALCSATYAWFTTETASDNNILISGHFSFSVSVSSGAGEVTPTAVDDAQGTTYTLAAGEYQVTLKLNDDTTTKGYCIVELGGVKRHTDVIVGANTANQVGYPQNDPFSFILKVEEDTVVSFAPHWGVSAKASIEADKTYTADEWTP